MFSYWEKKHFTKYDSVIIGAGLAGLFSAINLARKFPMERILVLDKEMFPAASTKNAGFACMGSITELEDDLKHSTRDDIISLFEKRYLGLQIMRSELGDESIGYLDRKHDLEDGSYELLHQKDLHALDKIEEWNKHLFSIANKNAFSAGDISTKHFKGFFGMIVNELEGEIDTGKMYNTLKMKARSMGIEIMLNTGVTSFEKNGTSYAILLENDFVLNTKRLILCTNAFTETMLPEYKIVPARAQAIIVKPEKHPLFAGTYHFDKGYYYFRQIDGLVLFGGGRNIDIEIETTNTLGANEEILNDLETKLREQILPYVPFDILYNWSGIMGKNLTKEPIAKQVDDHLFVLAGFGGMGVALAPYMARELTKSIT